MSEIFDATFGLTILAVIIAGAALAVSLWRRGVPREQIPQQAALRVGDALDAGRDRVVAWLHDELARQAAKATLKDRYFDADDFLADLGRLPASYEPTVTLTGLDGVEAMKRPGSNQVVRYYVQPGSGNVTTSKPT